MEPCYLVQIQTPKKILLNGLWFGNRKMKTVIILVHGLTASAFSLPRIRAALLSKAISVLTFNNRGFEQIAEVKKKIGQKIKWVPAGAGREHFRKSADDIQGVVDFARAQGARNIFLAGHSTGAQKIVYWASRSKRMGRVGGLVLLGPLSDYAGTKVKYASALRYARTEIKKGRGHTLMPPKFGHWFPIEAQRFVSLYSPDSAEEIFSYASRRSPSTLSKVKLPILAIFAGSDEHSDRPVKKIANWFAEHLKVGDQIVIVPRVKHSFKGGESAVARAIREFIRES